MPDSHFARHAFGDAAQHSAAGAQPRGWTPTPAADLAADLAASHPHYRILRLLDHGGMGAVYVATDTRPGTAHPDVAIKVLRNDALDDPAYVARFHREIALLQQLQHPGIVPVLDHGQTAHGLPFFVMPCLQGRTLHTVLQGPRLSEPRALDIMAQLCASVAAAHEKHIVHRDLKPQNIFLIPDPAENGRDRVIVLDYGIARSRHTTPLTVPAQSPGTFGYIAPEVLCGGEAGYPADIFALGVICHQLLTGNDSGVPFDPRLEPVVAKAMHNFPEKRFQTATEFAGVLAGGNSSTTTVDATRRRSFWLLAAVAGLLAATLIATALYLAGRLNQGIERFAGNSEATKAPASQEEASPGTAKKPVAVADTSSSGLLEKLRSKQTTSPPAPNGKYYQLDKGKPSIATSFWFVGDGTGQFRALNITIDSFHWTYTDGIITIRRMEKGKEIISHLKMLSDNQIEMDPFPLPKQIYVHSNE